MFVLAAEQAGHTVYLMRATAAGLVLTDSRASAARFPKTEAAELAGTLEQSGRGTFTPAPAEND